MLSETEKAYAAGIIDGEGCIGVYNTRTKGDKRAAYYQLTIRVCMRSPRIPFWFHERFPGSIHRGKTKFGKPTYTWQARNVEAESVLQALIPYLFEKQDQAKVALEFAEFRRTQFRAIEPWKGGAKGAKRYAPEVLQARDVYVEKLKLLKKACYPDEVAL
jgi:hypothetical protein